MSADGVDPAARGIAIGLDLGGSSVKFAVLGLQGGERPELLSSGLHEIPASRAPDVVVEILATTGNRLCEQFGAPERIGVGLPGLHDPEDGTTRLLPNFPPEWVGFPLRTELEARLPWPVVLGNDARAFALAEATMGAAVGFRTAVCIVLGTGVGGGVVIDGELWRGQGTGGELGHQTVELDGPPCGCGNRGCVEAIAGSAALLRGAGRSSVRSLVLIGDHSALDQQCSTSAHLEELGLARGGDAGADPAECEGRLATHLPQGVVERTALEVGREHWGAVGGERCRLESHGGAVCQAESRDRHDAGGFCQVQRLDLGRARLAELGGEQTRGGAHPSTVHVRGEAHEWSGVAMQAAGRDEGAGTAASTDQSLGSEVLHSLARGHPTHPELGGQFGFGRQRVACTPCHHPVTQPLFDLDIACGFRTCFRHLDLPCVQHIVDSNPKAIYTTCQESMYRMSRQSGVAGSWTERAIELMREIQSTQSAAIATAAAWSADAIEAGGLVHTFGSGHSRMAVEEMFPRYGSFPGFSPMVELSTTFHTQIVGSNGQRQAMFIERVSGLADQVLANFAFGAKDILMVFSVSGTSAMPVELAQGAQRRGVRVIGVTSRKHSAASETSTGVRLMDIADLVIDICTDPGDALVDIPGMDTPVGPGSTATTTLIVNEIKVQTAEILVSRGIIPPVLTAPAIVGKERSVKLFDTAYDDHAVRIAKSIGGAAAIREQINEMSR